HVFSYPARRNSDGSQFGASADTIWLNTKRLEISIATTHYKTANSGSNIENLRSTIGHEVRRNVVEDRFATIVQRILDDLFLSLVSLNAVPILATIAKQKTSQFCVTNGRDDCGSCAHREYSLCMIMFLRRTRCETRNLFRWLQPTNSLTRAIVARSCPALLPQSALLPRRPALEE